MPAQKDISVWVGNDSDIVMRWWSDSARSEPFDFAGSTLVFTARWDGGEIIKSTESGSIVLDDPSVGSFTVRISPQDTRALPYPGRVRYEIERHIGGKETTVVYGLVKVNSWGNTDG